MILKYPLFSYEHTAPRYGYLGDIVRIDHVGTISHSAGTWEGLADYTDYWNHIVEERPGEWAWLTEERYVAYHGNGTLSFVLLGVGPGFPAYLMENGQTVDKLSSGDHTLKA